MAGIFNGGAVTASLLLLVFLGAETMSAPGGSDNIPSDNIPSKDLVVGGEMEIPVDSPEVIKLSKIVTDKLSEGDNKDRTVVEIIKASVQVVSGSLTKLTLKISDGEEERLYKASIWEQPWLNKTEITKLEPIESV